MGNYEPAAHHRRQRLSRPGTSGLASQFDTTRHSIVHSPILQSASILRRYSLSATDRKTEIMVGLAPAAIMVLIEEDEIAIELESPHDALGPQRLALATASDWSPGLGVIYRLWMRREQVDDLSGAASRAGPQARACPGEGRVR